MMSARHCEPEYDPGSRNKESNFAPLRPLLGTNVAKRKETSNALTKKGGNLGRENSDGS